MKKRKRTNITLVVILMVIFPLVHPFLISMVYANTNYTLILERGTQILEVKKYDEATWINTVNITSTPSDWFGGDADKVGAKSKSTLLTYYYEALYATFLFFNLVIPQNSLLMFSNISNYGYNHTYITRNYPSFYRVWYYEYNYWNFTINEFDITPDELYSESYIFQDPEDFLLLLNDYNDFAGKLNNDTNLQLFNYSFPLLNGDDLAWQFFIRRISIANPKSDYLTTFINTIGCKNTTNQGNTLVLQRNGEKNYTVEVKYGIQGLIDHIIIKDAEGYVFYEITSFYPKMIVYAILGIMPFFIIGLIVVIIIKKYKQQRYFNLTK